VRGGRRLGWFVGRVRVRNVRGFSFSSRTFSMDARFSRKIEKLKKQRCAAEMLGKGFF